MDEQNKTDNATAAAEPETNVGVNLTSEYGPLEDQLRTALREVYDPELGMSVVELGLIRKFEWEPDQVEVTMILTTPFCPYGPSLIEQVRAKSVEVAQRTAKVSLGLEMWEPTMMEDQAAANWGLYY